MNLLEFGYKQLDITPGYGIPLCGYLNERPNCGAYDRLHIKTAVFRSENKDYAAIVSYDLCFVKADFIKEIESALASEKSPLAGKVMYCATHTHTGPYTTVCFTDASDSDYVAELKVATLKSLKSAFASLAPAELYAAQTECTTLSFNRRYIMKNGKILTNPGKLNPDIVKPEGKTDPAIMMLEIRQNGHPALLIANISNHADTVGGNFVSADWPGRMEAFIQNEIGFDLPVMTIIAPQGNINHFDVTSSVNQTGYEETKRIGKAYAAAIISARYRLQKIENTAIKSCREEFFAPYLQLTDEEYAAAKTTFEKYKNETMAAGQDFTSEDIAKGTPFVMKFFAERAIGCRENPIKEKRYEQEMLITFGTEIAILALPCEPFTEIGFAIRKISKYPITFLAALGMGEIGYVGLPENYGNGGYETAPSRDKADRTVGITLIKTAEKLLTDSYS